MIYNFDDSSVSNMMRNPHFFKGKPVEEIFDLSSEQCNKIKEAIGWSPQDALNYLKLVQDSGVVCRLTDFGLTGELLPFYAHVDNKVLVHSNYWKRDTMEQLLKEKNEIHSLISYDKLNEHIIIEKANKLISENNIGLVNKSWDIIEMAYPDKKRNINNIKETQMSQKLVGKTIKIPHLFNQYKKVTLEIHELQEKLNKEIRVKEHNKESHNSMIKSLLEEGYQIGVDFDADYDSVYEAHVYGRFKPKN